MALVCKGNGTSIMNSMNAYMYAFLRKKKIPMHGKSRVRLTKEFLVVTPAFHNVIKQDSQDNYLLFNSGKSGSLAL